MSRSSPPLWLILAWVLGGPGCGSEAYPAVPPIWSVESDDPNLAAILERLVEVRKGNTLLLQHLKRIISDLCKLYNLPQHPDVEMLDQPLPAEPQGGAKAHLLLTLLCPPQDTEDLDHYEMKEEEPADGKKTEDEGIGKENLAILEKIKKNQRQDYLNVRAARRAGGLGKQREPRARAMEAPAGPKAKGLSLARGTAVALRG
ncbi:ubiquitin-conjugating enzyme e2 hypothetical protein [Limosa lapponica baueri]|uniref:Uncharacterized protein n=1 Tax=Limosa lapponica baueri TaxID=1758121 RepID=A0A2I0T625_LIMLA|nr:ubiquitin-conjugating enzyme e2 hypothetical protein [Limosa lapponica baueri]